MYAPDIYMSLSSLRCLSEKLQSSYFQTFKFFFTVIWNVKYIVDEQIISIKKKGSKSEMQENVMQKFSVI